MMTMSMPAGTHDVSHMSSPVGVKATRKSPRTPRKTRRSSSNVSPRGVAEQLQTTTEEMPPLKSPGSSPRTPRRSSRTQRKRVVAPQRQVGLELSSSTKAILNTSRIVRGIDTSNHSKDNNDTIEEVDATLSPRTGGLTAGKTTRRSSMPAAAATLSRDNPIAKSPARGTRRRSMTATTAGAGPKADAANADLPRRSSSLDKDAKPSLAVDNAKKMAAMFRSFTAQAKPVQLVRQESGDDESQEEPQTEQQARIQKIQQIKERSKKSRARLLKLPSRGSALKEAVGQHDSTYLHFCIDEDTALTEEDMETLTTHSGDLLEKHGGAPRRRRKKKKKKKNTSYKKKMPTSIETLYKVLSASSTDISMEPVDQPPHHDDAQDQDESKEEGTTRSARSLVSIDTFEGDDADDEDSISISVQPIQDTASQEVQGQSRWKVHGAEAHFMSQVPSCPMRAPRTPSGHRCSISLEDAANANQQQQNQIVFEMTPGTKARIVGITQDQDGNLYMSAPQTPRGQTYGSDVISELSPGSASYMETPSTIHDFFSTEDLSPGTWVLLEDDDSESESESESDDEDDEEEEEEEEEGNRPKRLSLRDLPLLTEDSENDAPASNRRTMMDGCGNDSMPKLPTRRLNDDSDHYDQRQRDDDYDQ